MPLRECSNGQSTQIITTNLITTNLTASLCRFGPSTGMAQAMKSLPRTSCCCVPGLCPVSSSSPSPLPKVFSDFVFQKKKVKKNTIITATPLRKGVEENIKKIITTNILLLCAWVQNKIKNKPASRCRTKMAKELNFSLPTKKHPITTNKKKTYHYPKTKGVKGHMYHSVLGLCESAALSYTITVVGKKCAG